MATEEESIEQMINGGSEEQHEEQHSEEQHEHATGEFWRDFGEFENEDEFKTTFNDFKEKASKYEEESILWNKKQEELQKSIEEEKANRKLYITDEKLARLNILKNKNEDDFNFYKSIVLDDNKDPRSIIASKTTKKYSDLTPDEVNSYISEKYGLDKPKPDEDDYDTDEEYESALKRYERDMKINNIKMREDADEILDDYMKEFNSIELPFNKPLSKEELVIKQNANLEKWKPQIKDLTKSIGEMSFKVNFDKEEIPFDFSMNEEQVEKYSKVMSGLVHDNVIEFNEEGRKSVGEIMRTVIIKDQLQNMLNTVYEKAAEAISQKYEAAINGGVKPTFRNSGNGEATSKDEDIDRMLAFDR